MEKKPYLKEISSHPARLWFKAKRYGWGWYPCTWQGWAILAMYVFAMVGKMMRFTMRPHTAYDVWTGIVPQSYILTVFLIIICYATGEKPMWRWGRKTEDTLDVLDQQGTPTGELATRAEVHEKGLWHRAAHVYILNSKGEVLLQRRAAHNTFRPGRWYLSAGGHLLSGETSLEAAIREVRDGLGLSLAPENFVLAGSASKRHILLYGSYLNNEIDDIYVVHRDIDLSKLKKRGETADIAWIPFDTFKVAEEAEDPAFVSYEGLPVLFKYVESHAR